MLIIAVITLASVIAWAVTARALFRRWVRNEAFATNSRFHGRRLMPHGTVAALAIPGALIFPALAFTAFVMRNPPLSRSELEAKTRALEAENARLRQEQDNRADGMTCLDCGQDGDRPAGQPTWRTPDGRIMSWSRGADPRDPLKIALARLGIPARGDSHHYGTD